MGHAIISRILIKEILIQRNLYSFPIQRFLWGEFAIGTNTMAYAMIRRYNLMEQIPVLLMEKMGPHFAIGDPCYARGEKSPVFNLLDGKEITSRWNEVSRQGQYANLHVDMTLPYEEVGLIQVVAREGTTVDVIRDGLFVLKGLEELNIPLLEKKAIITRGD